MKLLIFNLLILAVTARTRRSKTAARKAVDQWQADTNKQCTRYRIMAKAVFEGNFPARVVLGIPADMEMSDNMAIMNVRKGCREMCGGQCTYRGEDLFNAELCEEFESSHGPTIPQKMVKPPKPHFTGEGSFDFEEWEPESDWEPEYVDWDPFWWMEAEKERQEEKEKLKDEHGDDYKEYMDEWMYSEGSYDWTYYGLTSDWYGDYSFNDMQDWWYDFNDTWTTYEWDGFKFDDIDYKEINGASSWDDDWWLTEGSWVSTEGSWYEKDGYFYYVSEGSYTEGSYTEGSFTEGSYSEWSGWNSEGSYTEGSYTEGSYTEGSYTEGSYVSEGSDAGNYTTNDGSFARKTPGKKVRKMGRALPKGLQNYMSNFACGAGLGEDDTPECRKAKEDFSNANGILEEAALQPACLEHCGQACGFLVNSVSFLLISLCYLLFNETH